MDTQKAESQKPVDREQVRMLVASVGYEEASKQTGIKAGTLRQWSKRFNWINHKPRTPGPNKPVTVVTSPSNALDATLKEHKQRTKLGFSKAAMKVAEAQSELPVEALRMPKEALVAKSWADVAGKAQGWDEGKQEQGVLGGLQVYSEQTVIQVGQHTVNESGSA